MTRYARVDLSTYVVISIWFGCNNRCTICMLGEMKEELPAIGFDQYKRALYRIREDATYQNLILSGAEVTTFGQLDRYVEFAGSLGWFKKIQIQTNGRRLADRDYIRHLVDRGVNEFFVSIQGLEAVHDAVTRVHGAFRETLEGIGHLKEFNVNVISNTVLTRANLPDIPELFALLLNEGVGELQLWNYFPMERSDTKDLVVSMKEFAALLPPLLSLGEDAGKALVFKSFPSCLSRGEPGFFDGLFPVTVLPDMFWKGFGECGFGACFHRQRGGCRVRECWGLSSAYLEKYGDERDLLTPLIADS
jgi:sulfatase maturation enzyme AslB (radical SAM superfamily)